MNIGEIATLGGFLLFYFTVSFLIVVAIGKTRILGRIWWKTASPRVAETYRVVSNRLVLVVLYLVVPLILLPLRFHVPLSGLGFHVSLTLSTVLWTVGLTGLAVAIALANPRRRALVSEYPMIRLREWSVGTAVINIVTWALYLFAYEFMFRSLLLLAFVPYGLDIAIGLNVSLYVTTHLVKSLQEGIASLPFGILLCFLSLQSGSFVPAFVIHLGLALATSFGSLRLHPQMSLRRSAPYSEEVVAVGFAADERRG